MSEDEKNDGECLFANLLFPLNIPNVFFGGGEKRSGALKNQGELELSNLEMVACLTGRVRGGIVFGEGAVGDAWSACAPSELSELMVLGTASPGWRLNACVPSGLWNPCVCVPSGLWNSCVCVPSGLWNPCACVPSGLWVRGSTGASVWNCARDLRQSAHRQHLHHLHHLHQGRGCWRIRRMIVEVFMGKHFSGDGNNAQIATAPIGGEGFTISRWLCHLIFLR